MFYHRKRNKSEARRNECCQNGNGYAPKKITPVYLIIGTEDYIINETKQLLIDNILEGEEVEFNYANLDLEEMLIEVVVQEAEVCLFSVINV